MIRKLEKREKNRSLYHMTDGVLIEGPNLNMSGDCSGLTGNCSVLRGDCTGLKGDCTGISGDLDMCDITDKERASGVEIEDLVFKNEEEK